MRVLLIGGTGFLGPDVVRFLTEAGHDVTILHRGEHEREVGPVRHVHGDRLGPELADAARSVAPEVILDMAPLTEAHAEATMTAAHRVARRVVAISSSDVYRAYGRLHGTEPGAPEPVPIGEDAPLREKLYPYRNWQRMTVPWRDEYDKIPVERHVMGDAEIAGTILRLAFVHGPRSYRYFEYLRRMDEARPVIPIAASFATWRGTRAYSEDVARAIALAVMNERAAGRVYNVGEAAGTSEADWVRLIGAAAGWDGAVVPVPEDAVPDSLRERLPKWMTERETQEFVLDTGRIRRELGHAERISREEGLRRTVAWMRENPPIGDHAVIRAGFDYTAEDELLAAMR